MKLNYKNLVAFTIFAVIWLFTGPTILNEFFNLEPSVRNFIPVAALSVLAVVLFVLKRKYEDEINHHQIDSLEMLIVAITPTVGSFTLLPRDDLGRIFMPIFLVIISVFWFIYFVFMIKPKKPTDDKRNEKEELFVKQTKRSTVMIFLFLLVLEIAVFMDILAINKWMP